MIKIRSIRNRMKMNSLITDIKNKVHREEFHTKAIPYHGVPFHDQIREAQDVLLQLGVEIKTRQRALRRLSKVLEDANRSEYKPSKVDRERDRAGEADQAA